MKKNRHVSPSWSKSHRQQKKETRETADLIVFVVVERLKGCKTLNDVPRWLVKEYKIRYLGIDKQKTFIVRRWTVMGRHIGIVTGDIYGCFRGSSDVVDIHRRNWIMD